MFKNRCTGFFKKSNPSGKSDAGTISKCAYKHKGGMDSKPSEPDLLNNTFSLSSSRIKIHNIWTIKDIYLFKGRFT